jgi:hypothetical protein
VCTASWLIREDGFELFFSRDESRARLPARPPEVILVEGVRALLPIDGDAGGSWIAVNELGIALCLLNVWSESGEPRAAPRTSTGESARPSRGWILRGLSGAVSQADVARALEGMDLRPYAGFRLAVFAPGAEPLLWRWMDGVLAREPARMPLASSSMDEVRAGAERARVLADLAREGLDGEVLAAFHASHAPERGPFSPCMHRAEAATRSVTHVLVSADRAAMRYAPGPLCEATFGPELGLARAAVRDAAL